MPSKTSTIKISRHRGTIKGCRIDARATKRSADDFIYDGPGIKPRRSDISPNQKIANKKYAPFDIDCLLYLASKLQFHYQRTNVSCNVQYVYFRNRNSNEAV